MDNSRIIRSPEPASEWGIKLVAFIIYPFGAFLLSLRNAASRSSYMIYALFGVLFCWHLNPVDLSRYDDLQGIMERVVATNISWNDLVKQFSAYFSFSDDAPKELYEA